MITVEARLNLSTEDKEALKLLMWKYSLCFNTVFNQLCDKIELPISQIRARFGRLKKLISVSRCWDVHEKYKLE